MKRLLTLALVLAFAAGIVQAQEQAKPTPATVAVKAARRQKRVSFKPATTRTAASR